MKQTLTIPWGNILPKTPQNQANLIDLVIPDRLVARATARASSPARPSAARASVARASTVARASLPVTTPSSNPTPPSWSTRLIQSIQRGLEKPLALISRAINPGDPDLIELLLPRGHWASLVSNGQSLTYRSRRLPRDLAGNAPRDIAREELICRAIARYAVFDPDFRAFTIPHSTETAMSRIRTRQTDHFVARASRLPGVDGFAARASRLPEFEFLRPEYWGFSTHINKTTTAADPANPASRAVTPLAALAVKPAPKPEIGYRWTGHGLFNHAHLPPRQFDHSLIARPRHRDLFGDTPTNPGRGDPYQCLPRLARARIEADYTVREAGDHPRGLMPADSAYRLALALGRCRLFGVEMKESDDFTLTRAAAAAAASVLYRALRRATRGVEELGQHLRRAGAYGRRDLAVELLEFRTDAWAAFLAIDESLSAAIEGTGKGTPGISTDILGKRVAMLMKATENYDANLNEKVRFLRPAAGTQLLENWRRLLAPAHRELLPWWLSGELECE